MSLFVLLGTAALRNGARADTDPTSVGFLTSADDGDPDLGRFEKRRGCH